MRPVSLLAALFAAALPMTPAVADDPAAPGVTVAHAWARATPGGSTVGVAYLEITAASGVSDRLVGVETPAAARAEIHTHLLEGGVMKMRRVETIALKPGDKAVLAPHGDHIMLMDLIAPLKEGDHLKLRLIFESAGAIDVEADVAAIGATAPAGNGSEHHH